MSGRQGIQGPQMDDLEREAYRLGRHGHAVQRPADSPADINGMLGLGAPKDRTEVLYFDHYVRGYNDAYRESLEFGRLAR